MNQVRIRDTCADDALTFELQRVEGIKGVHLGTSQEGAVARITCATEQVYRKYNNSFVNKIFNLKIILKFK